MSRFILVVEDEATLGEMICDNLRMEGYESELVRSGSSAKDRIEKGGIDLVILDIMMPGEDGLSLCRHIRETSEIPVILLTAKSEETDRIVGLEMGADDYVLKPFSPRELVARIKVIFRRVASGGQRVTAPDGATYAFAGWLLKSQERTLVDSEGVSLPLSTAEYNLMLAFATRPNQVLSRDQLLDITQGREANAFDRAIDNQISRLRKKIEPDPKNPTLIKTVWGGGYTLSAEVRKL